MNRNYPFTSDELRRMADQVDTVVAAIGELKEDDPLDWRWGLTVNIYDEDGDTVLGQIRPHDGWLGFFPKALSESDNA